MHHARWWRRFADGYVTVASTDMQDYVDIILDLLQSQSEPTGRFVERVV